MSYVKNHSSYLTGSVLLIADGEEFLINADNMRTDQLVDAYNLLDTREVRICLNGLDITEKVACQVAYDLSCGYDLVNNYNKPSFEALAACLPVSKFNLYKKPEGWLYEAASEYEFYD